MTALQNSMCGVGVGVGGGKQIHNKKQVGVIISRHGEKEERETVQVDIYSIHSIVYLYNL